VLHIDDAQTFVLQFTYNATDGFKPKAVSKSFPEIGESINGLRHPHAIAACGNYLLVTGQGPNPEAPGDPNEQLVIASWSENDLSRVGVYYGPNFHKTKMVTCAGNNGVLACGAFQNNHRAMGLAYFDDPTLSYSGFNTPEIKYLEDEIDAFNSNNPNPNSTWTNYPESYAQAIAPVIDANGNTIAWILAGQSGGTNNTTEDMVAMIVKPKDGGDYVVTHYSEVLNANNAGDSFANYVIQLSTPSGQARHYALFGKADWDGGVGDSYIAIIRE